MKTFHSKTSIYFIAFVCLLGTTLTSCKKDKTCHGHVNVYDNAGNKVPGATVLLNTYSINGAVTYTAKTDGNGEASFDVALPAIFDVDATKEEAFPNSHGKGSLNVDEPSKDGWTTVVIQ